MIGIDYFSAIMMLACVLFFFRAGKVEGNPAVGTIWASLSLLVFLLTPGGFLMKALGQVGLFFAIAFARALWEEYKSKGGRTDSSDDDQDRE